VFGADEEVKCIFCTMGEQKVVFKAKCGAQLKITSPPIQRQEFGDSILSI